MCNGTSIAAAIVLLSAVYDRCLEDQLLYDKYLINRMREAKLVALNKRFARSSICLGAIRNPSDCSKLLWCVLFWTRKKDRKVNAEHRTTHLLQFKWKGCLRTCSPRYIVSTNEHGSEIKGCRDYQTTTKTDNSIRTCADCWSLLWRSLQLNECLF